MAREGTTGLKTDIPLKILTATCGPGLLKLLGMPKATIVKVDTLELPFSERRLDNVLYMRSPNGQEYLHIIEWLGYSDKLVLWRLLLYIVQVALKYPHMKVVGTVIYLKSEYDVGDTICQIIDGETVTKWPLSCMRIYEYDAAELLVEEDPVLAALALLGKNVSAEVVEQVIAIIQQQLPYSQQADVLAVACVFAEPYVPRERFIQLVGKEHLMQSSIIASLVEEEVEKRVEIMKPGIIASVEEEAKRIVAMREAELEQERSALEKRLTESQGVQERHDLQKTLFNILAKRFPQAPVAVIANIYAIDQPSMLHRLIVELGTTDDFASWERLLNEVSNRNN